MALITFMSGILAHSLPSFSTFVLILITALPAYHLVILPIYYSAKSKLSTLPGPTLTLLTPYYITLLDALRLRTTSLYKWHLKYGPVVRVGPNEVSFTSATAIKQIYQDPTMEKDSRLYGLFTHFGAKNAFSSKTRSEHGWRRKGVAATLSRSKVLESERTDMWIGIVMGRYLKTIEENGLASKLVNEGNVRRYLVDVYLLSNWFAADVVTGFIFGCKRGTKTLQSDTNLHGQDEEQWWQKSSYHRRIINEHYAPTFRAHTYLYVEFPRLMRLVDKIINAKETVLKKLSALAEGTSDIGGWQPEVDGSKIDDWGWRTWMAVRADTRRCGINDTCVAEVLAGLVDGAGDRSTISEFDNDKDHRASWSDEIAASELMDLILAGMDTTSDTLSFLLYQLSLPSSGLIQSKLHHELVTAFPPSAWNQLPPFFANPHWGNLEVPPNYSYFLQAIDTLPYLDAVIKETLRLYTAIPGTLPRLVPEGTGRGKIIDGLYMPPGTVVGSFAYGIHRDTSVFGNEIFEPQRWIIIGSPEAKERQGNDDEEDWNEGTDKHAARGYSTATASIHKNSVQGANDETIRIKTMEKRLWAFGSGGRGCVGRHLAILEMKILVATIFWRYQTEIVTDKDARMVGKLDHYHWDHRKAFRDILPFKGVNGVLAFIPYTYDT
ncbi:cytochrome P450 [Tirmania nivea]|nr:cytochrome P450 [Tirmania nivea]